MKKFSVFLSFIFCIIFFFTMCEDEEKKIVNPSIELKRGGDYTFSNASARLEDTLQVGVIAESGNQGRLILFEIFRNGETIESIAINKNSLDADVMIIKDTMLTESWKFLVRDKSAGADSVSIIFTLVDTLSVQF